MSQCHARSWRVGDDDSAHCNLDRMRIGSLDRMRIGIIRRSSQEAYLRLTLFTALWLESRVGLDRMMRLDRYTLGKPRTAARPAATPILGRRAAAITASRTAFQSPQTSRELRSRGCLRRRCDSGNARPSVTCRAFEDKDKPPPRAAHYANSVVLQGTCCLGTWPPRSGHTVIVSDPRVAWLTRRLHCNVEQCVYQSPQTSFRLRRHMLWWPPKPQLWHSVVGPSPGPVHVAPKSPNPIAFAVIVSPRPTRAGFTWTSALQFPGTWYRHVQDRLQQIKVRPYDRTWAMGYRTADANYLPFVAGICLLQESVRLMQITCRS